MPEPITPNRIPPPITASVSSSWMSLSLMRWKKDWGGEATRLDVGEAEIDDEVEGDVLAVMTGVVGISREVLTAEVEKGGREYV